MKVFVTGSTGLLGSNLVKSLLDGGFAVRALVRDRQKASTQLPPEVEVVSGDLENIAQWSDQLQGCQAVVHCAAYFREYFGRGQHWQRLQKLNVEATMQLAQEALKHEIRRFVHISSSGTIGEGGNEDSPPGPEAEDNLYFKSKVLTDERLKTWPHAQEIGLVTVLPGWMFGPMDAAPTGSGRLIRDFLAGKLMAVPPGGASLVDARDVASAIVHLLLQEPAHNRYIVAGSTVSLAEIVQLLAKISGRPAPKIHLPYGLALVVAWLMELASRVTGRDPLVTRVAVRTMARQRRLSSQRAQQELKVRFRPLEETLRDSLVWQQSHA